MIRGLKNKMYKEGLKELLCYPGGEGEGKILQLFSTTY